MTRRAAILLSLTALVAGSMGLGFYVAAPPLERIPKPQHFEPVEGVSARIDRTTRMVLFIEEDDRTRACPIPAGHEEDAALGGIYSADHQSILVVFRHKLTPFREQETFEVLLNHKWATAQWEFWQFPLAPNSTPRLVAKLDTVQSDYTTFCRSGDRPVICHVVAAGPEREDEEYYRLRL